MFLFSYLGNEPDLEKFGDERPTKKYMGDYIMFQLDAERWLTQELLVQKTELELEDDYI